MLSYFFPQILLSSANIGALDTVLKSCIVTVVHFLRVPGEIYNNGQPQNMEFLFKSSCLLRLNATISVMVVNTKEILLLRVSSRLRGFINVVLEGKSGFIE